MSAHRCPLLGFDPGKVLISGGLLAAPGPDPENFSQFVYLRDRLSHPERFHERLFGKILCSLCNGS
jgi:hypothetical protein